MTSPSPSAKRIVVIGSSNTDMIVQLDRLPKPGETLLGGAFTMAAGGKGANQAVAAARAGGRVSFVACIGRDVFGDQAIAGFRRERIDVSRVTRQARQPSGVALILVSERGENCIAVAGGSNQALQPAHVQAAKSLFESGGVCVLQLETPLATVRRAAALARAQHAQVILNPAPASELSNALLRNVDLLTPNEHEAAILSGRKVTDEASAKRAAQVLRQRGARGVIITLGAAGAFVSTPGLEALIPGFQVKPVDTTAAGDVFNGALAVQLAARVPLAAAVRFAHAAAALSVTRLGAQPSIPRRSEILRLLKS